MKTDTKKVAVPKVTSRTTTDELCISVGNVDKKEDRGVKTDGIKIRGTGAATKGTKARGPMA